MIHSARLAPGTSHEAAKALSLRLLAGALLRERGIRLNPGSLAHSPEGKPYLPERPDIHVSITHCDGLAACVVADSPVGIDAERLRPHSPHAAHHAMGSAELNAIRSAMNPDLEFFRRWTLKESCLKAMGTGLQYPLRELEFVMDGSEAICIGKPEYEFRVYDLDGFILALCIQKQQKALGREHVFIH